ncbi:MAG: hypothetical protein M5U34_36950 [Chloroflexi bacterium]|nr:hypothetical protein [Chloroflexota bacterium]
MPPLTVKRTAFKFRSHFVDPADALTEARQMGASTKPTWHEHLDPATTHVPLRPLTPLKIGHMSEQTMRSIEENVQRFAAGAAL